MTVHCDATDLDSVATAVLDGEVFFEHVWREIERRARQLTRIADMITGLAISPDSRTYAFITTGTEGGRRVQSIWNSLILDGGPRG